MNLFSIFGALGGFIAIYLNKEIVGKNHFTTWHGRFGLAAVVGMFVSALWGIGAKYSSTFRNYIKPINTKLYHATFGLIGRSTLHSFSTLYCKMGGGRSPHDMRDLSGLTFNTNGLISVFCLGMSAICLACYSAWFRRRVEGHLWRIFFCTPIVLAVCMARQVGDTVLFGFFITRREICFCLHKNTLFFFNFSSTSL